MHMNVTHIREIEAKLSANGFFQHKIQMIYPSQTLAVICQAHASEFRMKISVLKKVKHGSTKSLGSPVIQQIELESTQFINIIPALH